MIGVYILRKFVEMYGFIVDVYNFDFILNIEIRDKVYVYLLEEKGIGGMLFGIGGRVYFFLFGGIDSFVVGFMIVKRGVEIEVIYFYSFFYMGEKVKEKVIDLCKVLVKYIDKIKFYIVFFIEI